MDESALRALVDRDAVRALLHGYAVAVDRKDLDAVTRCFTPDCAYEGSLGHGTIADALRALEGAFARYARTMHVVGTQAIELDGDVASAETYCVAHHVRHDGRHLVVGVRYVDVLVRTADGWRIRSRLARTEWTRDDPPSGE
jgi:ketosteroid isomerase-like protein